jgi:protein-L-isoaspartate(D-aspartate) O-methyltransferase
MDDVARRPRAVHSAARRMVEEQLVPRGIRDGRVLAAMASVPRHLFVPVPVRNQAYKDCAVPIGFGETIAPPLTAGWMCAALALGGDERVLLIGTGSGYEAALLGLLAREVYSIERHAVLARRARWTLRALGLGNVHVFIGDGSGGLPVFAPYDAIVVMGAAPIAEELLAQLGSRGRLVTPGDRGGLWRDVDAARFPEP